MKLHITEKALGEIVLPEGKRSLKVADTEVTGFGAQITHTGTGAYFVAYRDAQGQRKHEKLGSVGAVSAAAARAQAIAHLAAVAALREEAGRSAGPRRPACPSVRDFFYSAYLDLLKSEGKRYETHCSLFRNHVNDVLGHKRLDEVSASDVIELQSALRKKRVAGGKWKTQVTKTLAENTVKRVMILVRHLFNVAIADPSVIVTQNPTATIKLKSERKVKGRYLTKAEVQRLLALARETDPELHDFITLLALTGMRRANVLQMQWSWVDLERGTVTVPAEEDKARVGFVKHLNEPALNILKRRFAALQVGTGASLWVFVNPRTSKPYHSRRCAWETLRENAGLPTLRFHDLRHTFASMMLDSGSDIVDVQQALGHTQLKTTAVYLHLTEGRQKGTANAAAAAMGF
jgi:integrase